MDTATLTRRREMSELADRLENVLNGLENLRDNAQIRDDKYDFGYIGAMIDEQKEAIAALRSEQWIPVGERLPENTTAVLVNCPERLNIFCANYIDGTWQVFGGIFLHENVTHWMPLPAAPSREQDQRGGKSGETPDLEGLKVQSTPHLTASPARLSAEQIGELFDDILDDMPARVTREQIDTLRDMALSSITARDEGIEAAANVCRKELDDCPSTPRLFDRGYACACENLMERISALKGGK